MLSVNLFLTLFSLFAVFIVLDATGRRDSEVAVRVEAARRPLGVPLVRTQLRRGPHRKGTNLLSPFSVKKKLQSRGGSNPILKESRF